MSEILHKYMRKKQVADFAVAEPVPATSQALSPTPGFPFLPLILLAAAIFEALYVLIIALSPLPGLHFSGTPLAQAWPWTLIPSRLLFAGAGTPANHLTLLILTLVGLIAVYACIVWRTYKVTSAPTSRWLLLLLAGALLFGLTLLFQPALFSDDVFTYIFSGRILAVYHADPLNTSPIQFPSDPYLPWVISGRLRPNIYGPLWLLIASLLVSIGKGPAMTLMLFKAVALLSHLINCVLVWAILSRVSPRYRLPGTLLYAWNPLALIELAGSGHSDGLLSALLLLATLLYVQGYKRSKGRWYEIAAMLLFGLATSMNLVVLLLAPLFIWFLLRDKTSMPRVLWGFCWRVLAGLSLVIPIYMAFWRGASTFFAFISVIDMEHFVHSPLGLLTVPTHWFFTLVDQWSHFPSVMQPTVAADVALRASAIFIFALIYLQLFSKVRHALTALPELSHSLALDQEMRLPGFDVLLNCWASAVFWYLVLIMGWFWPWYVLWALWTVGLYRPRGYTLAMLLLSATALLVHPLLTFPGSPLAVDQSIFIFGIPLIYLFIDRQRAGRVAKR